MRSLLLLVALVAGACSCSGLVRCSPGTCPQGEHCVYVGNATAPKCVTACELGVDAGCPSGQSCNCAGSCPGCDNCVAVCTP